MAPHNIANDIADELAEVGLDAEDVSVDLGSIAQSRLDAHNRALEEGSARQELPHFHRLLHKLSWPV